MPSARNSAMLVLAGGQRQHAHPLWQRPRHAQPYVTTAHDEEALTTKAGRQRARTGGMQAAAGALV
jgi:hypothetical protein